MLRINLKIEYVKLIVLHFVMRFLVTVFVTF